jgi:uncharacterized protein YciI
MLRFTLVAVLLLVAAGSLKGQTNSRIIKMDSVTLKQYYFVMLKKGSRRNEITDTAVINKLQQGHMDNMKRMHRAGKLIVAGPFGDEGDWRGIFIFDCATEDEVKQLLDTDPAISAGRLDYEVHPWWTGMNSVFK